MECMSHSDCIVFLILCVCVCTQYVIVFLYLFLVLYSYFHTKVRLKSVSCVSHIFTVFSVYAINFSVSLYLSICLHTWSLKRPPSPPRLPPNVHKQWHKREQLSIVFFITDLTNNNSISLDHILITTYTHDYFVSRSFCFFFYASILCNL